MGSGASATDNNSVTELLNFSIKLNLPKQFLLNSELVNEEELKNIKERMLYFIEVNHIENEAVFSKIKHLKENNILRQQLKKYETISQKIKDYSLKNIKRKNADLKELINNYENLYSTLICLINELEKLKKERKIESYEQNDSAFTKSFNRAKDPFFVIASYLDLKDASRFFSVVPDKNLNKLDEKHPFLQKVLKEQQEKPENYFVLSKNHPIFKKDLGKAAPAFLPELSNNFSINYKRLHWNALETIKASSPEQKLLLELKLNDLIPVFKKIFFSSHFSAEEKINYLKFIYRLPASQKILDFIYELLSKNFEKDAYKLLLAVMCNKSSEVTNLLNEGIKVNCFSAFEFNPIHYAIGLDNASMAKLLIAQGASLIPVKYKDESYSILNYAALMNARKCSKVLLENKLILKENNKDFKLEAYRMAVRAKHYEFALDLLAEGDVGAYADETHLEGKLRSYFVKFTNIFNQEDNIALNHITKILENFSNYGQSYLRPWEWSVRSAPEKEPAQWLVKKLNDPSIQNEFRKLEELYPPREAMRLHLKELVAHYNGAVQKHNTLHPAQPKTPINENLSLYALLQVLDRLIESKWDNGQTVSLPLSPTVKR